MAVYLITASNWNSVSFWSGLSETTAGHTLDFSALSASYTVHFDITAGSLVMSDGATTFTVGDATYSGSADATLGGSTWWTFFTTIDGPNGSNIFDFSGSTEDSSIWGRLGDDTLVGGSGNDFLHGRGNDDTFLVHDGFGTDTIQGGEAGTDYDRIDLSALSTSATLVFSANEAGTISSGTASAQFTQIEEITLTEQADSIDLSAVTSAIRVNAGGGNDTFFAGGGSETLDGGAGDDFFEIEHVDGFASIIGGAGQDTLDGDDAQFLVTFSGDASGSFSFGSGTATGSFSGIEGIAGSGLGDVLDGRLSNTGLYIDAGGGADTVFGGAGDDTLIGGTGADTLSGGDGSDRFVVSEAFNGDVITGGEGGTDNDTLDMTGYTGGATLTLNGFESGTVSGGGNTLTFSEIESVDFVNSIQQNRVFVEDGASGVTVNLTPGSNNYEVSFRGGSSTINGYTSYVYVYETDFGTHTYTATTDPADLTDIFFDARTTEIDISFSGNTGTASSGANTLTFAYVDRFFLTDFNDTIDASSVTEQIDQIDGNAGDDLIISSQTVNVAWGISGGDGNDTIVGSNLGDAVYAGDDNDSVDGGSGNDTVLGQNGNDTLRGGTGNDSLSGGADADLFVIEDSFGNDTLIGGETATTGVDYDLVDFSAVTASGVTVNLSSNEAGTATDGADTITFSGIEQLTLTDQNDSVDGQAVSAAMQLDGGLGADTITGGSGTDTIIGGEGNDSLHGWSGSDFIDGGAGNDTLVGSVNGSSTLSGGAGNDEISVHSHSAGLTIATGGTGADTITLSDGSFDLDGGDDQDVFVMDPFSGNATVAGGEGGIDDDLFRWLSFDGFGGINVTLTADEAGTAVHTGYHTSEFTGIERFETSATHDSFDGSAASASMSVSAFEGDDTLTGGSGADTLDGGEGADIINGNAGDDGLLGGADADIFIVSDGAGNDTIDGGETATTGIDYDTLDLSGLSEGIDYLDWNWVGNDSGTISLTGFGITFDNIENFVLTAQNDYISGATFTSSMRIDAGDGNDTFVGSWTDDTLIGGAGDDTINGYDGADYIDAGAGADRVMVYFDGDDTILGGDDNDILQFQDIGFSGNVQFIGGEGVTTGVDFDILGMYWGDSVTSIDWTSNESGVLVTGAGSFTFSETEQVVLTENADTHDFGTETFDINVDGFWGNDIISGGTGADTLAGGRDADTIFGGVGADTLDGGDDDDDLVLGSGDSVIGGDGDDEFYVFDAEGTGGSATVVGGETGEDLTDGTNGGAGDWLRLERDSAATRVLDAYTIVASGDEAGTVTGSDTDLTWSEIENIMTGDGADTVDISADTTGMAVYAEGGNDSITGGTGNDYIEGGLGDDSIAGGDGDDVLKTGQGQDTLDGGAGNDTLMNSAGDDSLVGGLGDDLLVASAGNDTLEGGAGFDTLYGGTGNDSLNGGADADLLLGDMAGVTFNGTGTDGIGLASGLGDFPTTQLSYEITFSSTQSLSGYIGLGSYAVGTGASSNEFVLDVQSGTVHVAMGPNIYLNTGIDPSAMFDGGVHTIVVTWDSGTGALDLYFDGSAVYSGTHSAGTTLTQGGTFAIGQEQDAVGGGFDSNQIFEGTVYGVRLYDDVRTPAEVLDSSHGPIADNSDPNLIANWVADPESASFTDMTGSHAMTMSGDLTATWDSGNDILQGGTGADTLYGGGGNDSILGQTGDDSLAGGEGNDTFGFTASGNDTITDFNSGNTGTLTDGDSANNDFIDLSPYYDNIWELYGDQADDGILNQSNALSSRGKAVDYSDNTSMAGGSLTFDGAVADSSFYTVENTSVVCFTGGTRILTPTGDRLIEDLKPGDLVCTQDNGPQRLWWIGARRVTQAEFQQSPNMLPILVSSDLTGGDAPLLVSPQHCLIVKQPKSSVEKFVRAAHLAKMKGGHARVAKGKKQVAYYHLLFARHEVVFANSAPAESFYPGKMALRMLPQTALNEIEAMFPGISEKGAQTTYGPTARDIAPRKELPNKSSKLAA